MNKLSLEDRMKLYENQTTKDRLIPLLPVVCRIDGKKFSTFVRGLKIPYDIRLTNLMIETCKYLVEETNANIGFVGSDEISLCWYNTDIKSQMFYDGKIYKIIGDLAAMSSVYFNEKLSEYLPEKVGKRPRFDCRVFNVPNIDEAVNYFISRENSITKNSISMAAQSVYSHSELNGKNSSQKQEMLFQNGINWDNYPASFKRGTYIQRKVKTGKLTIDELEKLPLKHNARNNENFEFERKYVEELDLPQLTKVKNKIDVIIYGKDYIV